MKQFVLDYLAEEYAKTSRVARVLVDSNDADLWVELTGGKEPIKVAVYVINRAIRLPEIRETYEKNTRRKIHTMFLVDGRMVPDEGEHAEPPGWMGALHTLMNGRVYAYWCDRREVKIRPVHFEWRWREGERRVEYGQPVRVETLRPMTLAVGTRQIDGTFASAEFGEGAFWKKHDPNDYNQRSYSWRDWSFGGSNNKRRSEEPQAEGWDPWDEFQRQYGDAGEFYTSANGDPFQGARQQSSRSRGTPGKPQPINPRHFATLGVSAAATPDEIKQAYRRKARENHPDLHPTEKEKYTARMAEINAAFEAISRGMKD